MSSSRLKVLVIDALGARQELEKHWRSEFESSWRPDGRDLLQQIDSRAPDVVVVLDSPSLPEGASLSSLIRGQRRLQKTGIVLVQAREDVEGALAAFEAGVDDCLSWPVPPQVLGAHVRAVAWRRVRRELEDTPVLRAGPIQLDMDRCELRVGNQRARLTRTELELMRALMARPGWVVRRAALLNIVPGHSKDSSSHALDTHVSNLRKKLGACGHCLSVVKGVGYCLDLNLP